MISVDRSGLRLPRAAAPVSEALRAPPAAPMAAKLWALRRQRGHPLTLAEYVEACLTDEEHGYYTTKAPGAVFGATGSFVTSPEISQMFSELVGLWCAATWEAMGSPRRLRLVEMGPGRGTLMADLLRGTAGLPGFGEALEVEMVEVSPSMRAAQREALGVESGVDRAGGAGEVDTEDASDGGTSRFGPRVTWRGSLAAVPSGDGVPALFIAHELFDALPVHQFRRTEKGWCEVMVETADADDEHDTKLVLSPGPTTAAATIAERRLAAMDAASAADLDALEVSPAGWALAGELARRVADDAAPGAALIVDYGRFAPYGATLQGIRDHAFVDVMESPGDVDLSAYVDFQALAQAAAEAAPTAAVYEAVDQATFLKGLGIDVRTEMLAAAAGEGSESAAALRSQRDRLTATGADGMGERFMAMAIAHAAMPPPPMSGARYAPYDVPGGGAGEAARAVAPGAEALAKARAWGKIPTSL